MYNEMFVGLIPESVTLFATKAQLNPIPYLDTNSTLDFSNLAQAECVCAPMRGQRAPCHFVWNLTASKAPVYQSATSLR